MKNNNNRMIYKLAYQSLKASKMRNIFVLIAITLSVSLLSGITFFSNALEEVEKKELSLRQHAIYHDISLRQITALQQDEQISEIVAFKSGKSFEVDNYILLPYYLEQNESAMLPITISEGTYPTKMNEVLVDKQLLTLMGVDAKIGQKITIAFLDGTVEEFEVSGLISSEYETNVFSLFLSNQYAIEGSQLKHIPLDAAIQLKDASKMNSNEFLEILQQIGAKYGIERKYINENNSFVDSLSYNFRELNMIALIGITILLVSVLVIYSIFYISVSERTRQFGQLRTLGMTKKQIKKMVCIEGTILSFIGSIFGIVLGAIFAFSMKPKGFNLSSFVVYSLAILLADYITVRISISKPARIAANISPIEASKFSGYEINKDKKITKKLHRKLSPLSLSFIAACGNQKKSVMTIVSLGLAGIVFMCASSFLHSMNEEEFSRQGWFEYGEYVIDLSSNAAQVSEFGYTGIKMNNPLNNQLTTQLQNLNGVKDINVLRNLDVIYTYNGVTGNDLMAPFSQEEALLMQPYIKSDKINYDKMIANREILICNNDIVREIFGWKFEVGDQVTLKWYNGEKYVEDIFTIAGEVNKSISNNSDLFMTVFNTGWFLIPGELLDEMMISDFNLNNRIIISTIDSINIVNEVEEVLTEIEEKSPLISLSKLSDSIEHHRQQYNMIYATSMGAALFVISFSLVNLLNTLITNAMARKREFACFRTLGMSEKQIAIMIQGEGMYFAIINILIALTLGTICGYILVKVMAYNGLNYMQYQFPMMYLIGYIILVLIVPVMISYIITKVLRKKSLIETLREIEN